MIDAKRDYRSLLGVAPDDVWVFPPEKLPGNPLAPPPGLSPRRWEVLVADCFCSCFGLLGATQSFLLRVIDALFTSRGIHAGSGDYPTLNDLIDGLRKPPFRLAPVEHDYRARALARAEGMRVALPALARQREGLPIAQIPARPRVVVLELDGLSEMLFAFLSQVALLALYHHQMVAGGAAPFVWP